MKPRLWKEDGSWRYTWKYKNAELKVSALTVRSIPEGIKMGNEYVDRCKVRAGYIATPIMREGTK